MYLKQMVQQFKEHTQRLINNKKLINLTSIDNDNHNFIRHGKDFVKSNYSQSKVLNDFIGNESLIFSFVRDPISKFLSAFYEAHVRIFIKEVDTKNIPKYNNYKHITAI